MVFMGGLISLLLGWFCPAVVARVALENPIVMTQVPREVKPEALAWEAKGLARADWFVGARIVVVAPDGSVRVLSAGFASACDANVSFDAQRVVFAGKKAGQANWRIWEIGLDGQGLRPVSPENQDARGPLYASTLFTLDSPEPWFTLVYVATDNIVSEAGARRLRVSTISNWTAPRCAGLPSRRITRLTPSKCGMGG